MLHVKMEALYFLSFWRSTNIQEDNQPSSGCNDIVGYPNSVVHMDDEFDKEEDSYFELELSVPNFDDDNNPSTDDNSRRNISPLDTDSNRLDSVEAIVQKTTIKAGVRENKCHQPTLSLSPSDFPSKRSKILPFEHNVSSKAQSFPTSLLKSSAPSFRDLMFEKSKSMEAQKAKKKAGGKDCLGVTVSSDTTTTSKHRKQDSSSKLFTLKFFKLEQAAANVSMFTKQTSLRKHFSSRDGDSLSSSDRGTLNRLFNKEGIHKYLKLIKPLYIKASKKQSDNIKFSGELSVSSSSATLPLSTPKEKEPQNVQAGNRVVCKHLWKSKSTGVSPSTVVDRRDDSLLLQYDGIQSAILHCKKSFNSSRDSSHLSRFGSDPLPDKSMSAPRIPNAENGMN